MMPGSRIGSRFREVQARTLGQFRLFGYHGQNKSPGVVNDPFGGTATDNAGHTTLEGGEASAGNVDGAASAVMTRANGFLDSGILVIYNSWHTNNPITDLQSEIYVGMISYAPIGSSDGYAAFRPGIGDSTDGNIEVVSGGTATTGSLTYPQLDAGSIYTAMVVDNDRDETRFYIDKSPFYDQEDATIAATPSEINPPGGEYTRAKASGGTDDELRMSFSGYIYVP